MGLKEDLQHNQRAMRDMGIGGDSGQPEFYQYQWDLQERNPKYDPRGTSEQPIFKYTLRDQSPNSVIKDVVDETGKKVGAYNTQTGFKYGLTNPDLVKAQNDIVNSQSPNSGVNQTVESVMGNSLLTSPATPNYITSAEVEKLNNSSKLANDSNPVYEGVYNITKGFGNMTTNIRNWKPF